MAGISVRRLMRHCVVATLLLTATKAIAQTPTASTEKPKEQKKRIAYAPGITLDLSVPQVEISAKVSQDKGPVGCFLGLKNNKNTCLLVTHAEAKDIRAALKEIGLKPGFPTHDDKTANRRAEATGHRLAISIGFQDGNLKRTVAAHEWLLSVSGKAAVEAPRWVFSGSTLADEKLAAQDTGVIASLVDSESAIIGIQKLNPPDRPWAEVDSRAKPKVGSECRVLIRALEDEPIVLQLTPEGYFTYKDDILSPLDLDELVKSRIRHNPGQVVELSPMEGASNLFAKVAARAITGSGIAPENMKVHLRPEKDEEASSAVESSPAQETASGKQAETAKPKSSAKDNAKVETKKVESPAPSPSPSPSPSPKPHKPIRPQASPSPNNQPQGK